MLPTLASLAHQGYRVGGACPHQEALKESANGDGAEDLMLRVSEWPGYAHTSRSKTLLVTRHEREAVMRALPWPWAGGG